MVILFLVWTNGRYDPMGLNQQTWGYSMIQPNRNIKKHNYTYMYIYLVYSNMIAILPFRFMCFKIWSFLHQTCGSIWQLRTSHQPSSGAAWIWAVVSRYIIGCTSWNQQFEEQDIDIDLDDGYRISLLDMSPKIEVEFVVFSCVERAFFWMLQFSSCRGTGLMGPLLKDLGVEYLEGVDLSSKMLEVESRPFLSSSQRLNFGMTGWHKIWSTQRPENSVFFFFFSMFLSFCTQLIPN